MAAPRVLSGEALALGRTRGEREGEAKDYEVRRKVRCTDEEDAAQSHLLTQRETKMPDRPHRWDEALRTFRSLYSSFKAMTLGR